MLIYANPLHARHAGRHEMFRGQLVPCHEPPARLEHVLAELARRPVGELREPPPATRDALERIHAPRYLDFLASAWDQWVALDPAHAALDALPSVWPVRGFRDDVEPANFAARMGLYSFDAGTPLTAGTWAAAEAGAACALAAARAVREPGGPRAAVALTRPPGHHAGADFAPDALVVALGVDTYEGDPISRFTLASTDYPRVGRHIAALKLPTVFTLEGGYAVAAMGVNVVNVLEGFEAA